MIEILPPPVDGLRACGSAHHVCDTNPFKHMYEELAEATGVFHLPLVARLAPPCAARTLRGARLEQRLRCNLSVPVTLFAQRMRTLRSLLSA